MSQYFFDFLYSFGNCLNCFPGSPTLKINSRSFKILRLLGEGGFSYVYLVEDTSTNQQFALKKIRCPFGAESVAQAMREVEAYRLFANTPGIIHAVDHAVAAERGGEEGAKTVYILLPYYRRGNLQDMMNANLVAGTTFPERRLVELFLDVCRAVGHMHHYRGPGRQVQRMQVDESGVADGEGGEAAAGGKKKNGNKKAGKKRASAVAAADDEDEGEQQRPLMDGEDRIGGGANGAAEKSYVHRDIKPGNIMIADDGLTPIVMDLGSLQSSPQVITTRSAAVAAQDTAAEHSTMPYRAPELFDVKTGAVLDGRVDVWSLGCTLFACLVGKSPFEMRSDETGGSLSMCVLGGDWRFPDEGPGGKKKDAKGKGATPQQGTVRRQGTGMSAADAAVPQVPEGLVISEPVKELVRKCLKVETAERPDIDELIALVERTLEGLPEDEV